MAGSPKKSAPDRSLSAFVEGVAHLLRSEAKEFSLKERNPQVLKKGAAHKIEQIALLLRKKVHESRSKKARRSPKAVLKKRASLHRVAKSKVKKK